MFNRVPSDPSIVGRLLLVNAGLLLLFMSLSFLVAYKRQRVDTVDTAWGLGFVLVAWAVVAQRPVFRTELIACLVTIWGARLATHLFRRSRERPEDRRYAELRGRWKGNIWVRAYVSVFLLQGVLVWLISAPIVIASNQRLIGWGWLSVLGAVIWLTGFILEAIADRQLSGYLNTKDRPKVLRTGLWRYSRHPNYFGELTQWWGIGIIALQVSYGWVGLIGPLILSITIIFVSGVPPIEKHRAKDQKYHEYQRQTSAIIPLPSRKKSSA